MGYRLIIYITILHVTTFSITHDSLQNTHSHTQKKTITHSSIRFLTYTHGSATKHTPPHTCIYTHLKSILLKVNSCSVFNM